MIIETIWDGDYILTPVEGSRGEWWTRMAGDTLTQCRIKQVDGPPQLGNWYFAYWDAENNNFYPQHNYYAIKGIKFDYAEVIAEEGEDHVGSEPVGS